MKYKYIFADADNTLLDFDKAEETAFKALLSKYNIDFSFELLNKYREDNKKLWEKIERGEYTKKDLFKERFLLLKGTGTLDYDASIDEMNSFYATQLSKCSFVIDGAEELLKKLKDEGCFVYLVTNGIKMVQDGRLKSCPLTKYFDGIYISEVVGFQKPQIEFFDFVFSDTGITDKSKCIILGDSLSSDMQGGRNAKIATCRYLKNEKKGEKNPLCDYEIEDLLEFIKIVM